MGDIDSDNDGGVDIPDVDVADALDRFDLAMVDFPVDIRLNLTASPLVQPYFLFGPVFSVPSSGNDFIDKNLESLLVTGNVGMGLSINIAGISLFPEFRYSIGITRLIKDSVEIGGVAVETDVQRVNSVLLRIGSVL